MAVASQDLRLLLLHEVIASRTFQKSPRLSQLLEFICTRLLEGRVREINEQQIGVHVFGRSETYNPADDSIVRTQARLLRQRLEEYFEHECPTSALIITIPKGGYVPYFQQRGVAEVVTPTPASVEEPQLEQQTPRFKPIYIYTSVCVLVLLLLAASFFYLRSGPKIAESSSSIFWSNIFPRERPVLIVPSDDALVLFEEAIGASVSLDDYLSGNVATAGSVPTLGRSAMNPAWFSSHQYTSTADLQLALRLSRLPAAARSNIETKNARALRIADLKGPNVILIGGRGSNPWVGLFSDRLNFDLGWDWKLGEGYVINKHPAAGEPVVYRDTLSNGERKSYGVLAYLPGIDRNGVALLFEGTGMAGTEAASDFPFSDALFSDFSKSIGATAEHFPYFEVLLETTSVAGNAPEARIISYRFVHP